MDDGELWWYFRRHWQQSGCVADFDHDLLRPVGERLWQLDLPDDHSNCQSAPGGSDIRFGQPGFDLLAVEQHVDGDGRIGNNVSLVYRQLRRNARWDGRSGGQSSVNNNILRQDEEQRLRRCESGLRDGNRNSQRAACCSDIRVG